MNWLLFVLRALLSALRIGDPTLGAVRARLDGRTESGLFQDRNQPARVARDVGLKAPKAQTGLFPCLESIKAGFAFTVRRWLHRWRSFSRKNSR